MRLAVTESCDDPNAPCYQLTDVELSFVVVALDDRAQMLVAKVNRLAAAARPAVLRPCSSAAKLSVACTSRARWSSDSSGSGASCATTSNCWRRLNRHSSGGKMLGALSDGRVLSCPPTSVTSVATPASFARPSSKEWASREDGLTPERARRQGSRGAGKIRDQRSVAFGWPQPAQTIQTVRVESSGQYQTRPPPVTSYCHCCSLVPRTSLVPRSCFNWAIREALTDRSRGSRARCSHISRMGPGACLHRSSQPAAGGFSAKTSFHSPARGGGAARSLRLGKVQREPSAFGLGTAAPLPANGRLRFLASSGSA